MLSPINMLFANFTGNNGTGAISLPGARVGDAVWYCGPSAAGDAPASNYLGATFLYFESVISVDDEIQQVNGANVSTTTFSVILVRRISVS